MSTLREPASDSATGLPPTDLFSATASTGDNPAQQRTATPQKCDQLDANSLLHNLEVIAAGEGDLGVLR